MSEDTTTTEAPARKRGGTHPKHPRCPGCGKALRKRSVPGVGGSKKSDPYRWCFNKGCDLHGVDQSDEANADKVKEAGEAFQKAVKEAAEAKAARKKARAEAAAKRKAEREAAKTDKPAKKPKAPKSKKSKSKKPAKPEAEPEVEAEASEPEAAPAPKKSKSKKGKGKSKKAPKPAPEPEASGDEPERSAAFIKARKRIAKAVEDDGELSRNIIDLALSMVKKADGVDAVNALITEFNLTERFDVEPLSEDAA